MPKRSAGLLAYRRRGDAIDVLLVHPGGPFWADKDEGAWSIPKGEHGPDEDPLDAARREFHEETSFRVDGPFVPLGTVTHASGKRVAAWAVETDLDADAARSNTFSIEWPPRSGRLREFPEVDRAAWFGLDEARAKLLAAQHPLLDRLRSALR